MRTHFPYSPMKRAITEHLRNGAEAETSIGDEHSLIYGLCDRLEAVADGLPELPDSQSLQEIVAFLRVGIPAHCAAEEVQFTDMLTRRDDSAERLSDAFLLVRREHAENEAANLELAEMLEDLIGRHVAPTPDALGFMLRQVFVLTRRHLAWEDFLIKHVLPDH